MKPNILRHDQFTNPVTHEKVDRQVYEYDGHIFQFVQTAGDPVVLVKVDEDVMRIDLSDEE